MSQSIKISVVVPVLNESDSIDQLYKKIIDNLLDSNYEIIKTNKKGEFQIVLKPGIYTFFILKDDKIYLNHFDGLGNYSHIKVKDNIDNFIIRDYQNAYF